MAACVRSLLVPVFCTNKDLIYPATPSPYYPHTVVFLMDYFNNCNFSKHRLMRSLMMV